MKDFSTIQLQEALRKSFRILSPYSDPQRWEFDSNLFHLSSIVSHIKPTDTIVDLGCGIGILALSLKLLGYSVDGVDKYVFENHSAYSIQSIDHLKRIWKQQGLNIVSGDALQEEVTRTYDVVISVAVIEHQSDLKAFMAGILSYLKPGGHVYVATPNGVNFLNRLRVLCGRAPLGNISEFFTAGKLFTGHWREYTVDELKTIARLAQLTVVEVGNVQTVKSHFTSNWRKWHSNVARIAGWAIPHTGDTNYIWAKK